MGIWLLWKVGQSGGDSIATVYLCAGQAKFHSSLVYLAVLKILNRHKVVSVGLAAVLW